MKSKIQFAVAGVVASLLIYACSGSSGSVDTPAKKSSPSPSPLNSNGANSVSNCLALTGATSWQSGISTIFQTSCVSCHATYATYAGVSASITTILSDIDSGRMPRGTVMSSTDKAAIHAWSTAGMPQTNIGTTTGATPYPGATSTPPTQNCGSTYPTATPYGYASPSPTFAPLSGSLPTYSGGIQSIMTTYCVSCHATFNTQYAVQQNYYNIMSRVNAGTMPKGSILPSDKKLLLQQWGTAPNTPYGQFAP